MRKKIKGILIFMLSASMLVACGGIGSPEVRTYVGVEVSILKEDTVKVTGATKEDGKIVVSMDINFNTIALDDLQIRLSGYDVGTCDYDKEGTLACNEKSVFSKGYVGPAWIVFTNDTITSEQELSEYTIQVEYHKGKTRVLTNKFMLENDYIGE